MASKHINKLIGLFSGVTLHSEWRLIVIAVLFCSGVAIRISLWRDEPTFLELVLTIGLAALLFIISFGKRGEREKMASGLLLSLVLGLCISQVRLLHLHDDFEPKRESVVNVTGRLERLDVRSTGLHRMLIAPIFLDKSQDKLPKRVRVLSRIALTEPVEPGSLIEVTIKVSPPGGPVYPGGFDFSRAAFFKEIQMEGIAITPLTVVRFPDSTSQSFLTGLMNIRESLEYLFTTKIQGQPGALATALTVGFRNHLSNKTVEDLRRAGLSHVLAISGLHMGLVSVAAFFLFELLIAAIPFLRHRAMPKKLAVFPTWLVALSYLFLSGASTSTVRAFIMVSVGLIAVMADRRVLSLRSVAIAALIIVAIWPEFILSIGFQMSFAATAALVATYEVYAGRRALFLKKESVFPQFFLKGGKYIGGTMATSLIAQLAIAPIALYHFQELSVIGIAANVLVLPIIGLCVMPLLFFSILMIPVNGLAIFSPILEYALELVLEIASFFSELSFATIHTLPLEPWIYPLLMTVLICLLIVRGRPVSIFLSVVGFFGLYMGQIKPADLLISKTGATVAEYRGDEVYFSGGKSGSFQQRSWMSYWGKGAIYQPERMVRSCSSSGCAYDVGGKNKFPLVRANGMAAVRDACSRGKMVLLQKRYVRYCRGAKIYITYEELEQFGPVAVSNLETRAPTISWSRNTDSKSSDIAS